MFEENNDIKLDIPTPLFETTFELIKLSLKVFFKSFWFISKVILPIYLPLEVIEALAIPSDNLYAHFKFGMYTNGIFFALIQPALVFGIAHFLHEKTFPPVLESYRFGWHRWGNIWGRYFVSGCIMIFGFLMLIVPGVLASIAYSLITCVMCFESHNLEDPIRRSRELSLGYRKRILFSVIPLFFLALAPNIVATVMFYVPASILDLKVLETSGDIFAGCLFDITYEITLVSVILVYLKAVKDKKKKAKETWLLRWAR